MLCTITKMVMIKRIQIIVRVKRIEKMGRIIYIYIYWTSMMLMIEEMRKIERAWRICRILRIGRMCKIHKIAMFGMIERIHLIRMIWMKLIRNDWMLCYNQFRHTREGPPGCQFCNCHSNIVE